MIISFTGTQQGMTSKQFGSVQKLLRTLRPSAVHHGDCLGADEQFDTIATSLSLNVTVHPPSNSIKRAYCNKKTVNCKRNILKPKSYKDRNRDIVNAGDLLIAAPYRPEYLRSGTWSTVRYARKQCKTIIIIEP